MTYKFLAMTIATTVGPMTSQAQVDSLTSFQNQFLNQVVVTGTRTPKTLANTPVLTRVISTRDIERLDATNVKDVLLAELPGLEFSYSMNQQTSLTMQGLGGMSILFLIDGERMAGETLDNIDFQRLSMDNIERIEIVKGAATALYGSNAVGAVINIITKSSKEPWSLHLNSRVADRHNEQRHGGSFGLEKGRFNNMLNVQADGIDGYKVFDKDGDSTLVYGSKQINIKDKLTYRLSNHSQLTSRAGFYFHERNSSALSKDRARDYTAGLRYMDDLTDNNHLDVGYTFDRYDKSDYYPSTKKEFLDYKNVQNVLRGVYTHNFEKKLDLTLGGDAMHDYLMSYQFSKEEDDHDQFTADVFAQADWKIDKHWNIVGGLRGDYFSRYGWEVTPKLSAMFSYDNLRIRGNYSRGFRAPTLKEMYMNFNMANIFYIYGNKDLESERSHSFSLGGEYTFKNLNFTLTSNYNILNNEITTLWNSALDNGKGAMQYHNVDGTRTFNVEATAAGRYDCGIGFRCSYAYFLELPKGDAKRTATTRPHSLTAHLCYDKRFSKNYNFGAMISGRFLSEANYYTLNNTYDGYTPSSSVGYTMWKLTLTQRFFDVVNVTMAVDNLFNYTPSTYEFNSPYTVGRTFSIGAQLDVEKLVEKLKTK